MPETSDAIVLPLTLDTLQAEQALASFKAGAKASGREIAGGLQEGTKAAGGFFDSMRTKMVEYRREEVQQARNTRFFAGELMGIVPAGTAAAGAISKVAVILGGGLGLGATFELAKWGVEAFTAAQRESSEALKKLADENKKALEQISKDWQAFTAGQVASYAGWTEAEKLRERQLSPIRAREVAILQEIAKAQAEAFGSDFTPNIGKNLSDLKRLNLELDGLRRQREAIASTSTTGGAMEAVVAEEKARAAQVGLARKALIQVTNLDREAAEKRAAAEQKEADEEVAANERWAEAMDATFERFKQAQTAHLAEVEAVRQHFRNVEASKRNEAAAQQLDALDREYAHLEAKVAEHEDLVTALELEKARRRRQLLDQQAGEDASKRASFASGEGGLFGLSDTGAQRLEQLSLAYDQEQRLIESVARSSEEADAMKAASARRYAAERLKLWQQETFIGQQQAQLQNRLANLVGSGFASMATHAGAFERAMAAQGETASLTASQVGGAVLAEVQAIISGVAAQAGVKAVYELAAGFASLFLNPAEASSHFTAAGLYGSVAGMAAGAGFLIGELRPMTRGEQDQVDAAKASALPPAAGSTTSPGSYTDNESMGARGAGSSETSPTVIREIVFVIGDPYETPAETARRAQRRLDLAKQLDMRKR